MAEATSEARRTMGNMVEMRGWNEIMELEGCGRQQWMGGGMLLGEEERGEERRRGGGGGEK